MVPQKKPNCCVVCCCAVFCCKTQNIVSKEAELAQIKLANQTADKAKQGEGDNLEVTQPAFQETIAETQPLMGTIEPTAKPEDDAKKP
jgi:hypothetical protein